MYNNELYHHGIKGMKWGVRRYQNKDGSLTPAGKKRRSKEIYTKIKQNSGKNIYFTDLTESIEEDVKSHDSFKQYKKAAKETWRKFLEESDRMDNDYDRTIRKIHKDPAFKKELAEAEKSIAEKYGKDTRGYEKAMGYAIDALESEHPLWKQHEERKKKQYKLLDEAYGSAKKVADEILGKYGDKPANNWNRDDAKARDIVASVISDDMLSDYYQEKYRK